MTTCPSCATENKEGAPFCANCRKPLPKKPKQIGTQQPVIEQIPHWLTLLLTKYGETSGPLVGVSAQTFAPGEAEAPDFDFSPGPAEADAELSALLDQMAEESPSRLTEERLATSVEWGAYGEADEAEAHPIDDLLASMGKDLEQSPSYDQQPQTLEQETGDFDIPDWLSDSPASQELEAEGYDQPAETAFDIPDWLSEETLSGEESDYSTAQDAELPDWLKEPGAETPSEPQPSGPSTEGQEVPDWLSATQDMTASSEETPSSPSDSTLATETGETTAEDDVEVPGWLLDELDRPSQTAPLKPPPSEPFKPSTPSPVDQVGVEPIAQSSELEPAPSVESSAWLDELQQVGSESREAEEAELSQEDLPDWLSELPAPAADEPETEPVVATSTPEDEPVDWSVPDWITAAAMTDEEEEELKVASVSEDQTIPDWLSDTEPVEAAELEDPSTEIESADDWLASLDVTPVEEEDSPADAAFPLDTDWLVDLDAQLSAETASPTGEGASPPPPDPDRVTDLVPPDLSDATAAEESIPPDWAVDLSTPTTGAELGTEIPSVPDWTQEQVTPGREPEAETADKPIEELTTESEPAVADSSVPPVFDAPDRADSSTAEEKGPVDWIAQFSPTAALPEEPPEETDWLPEESSVEDGQIISQRLDWLLAPEKAEPQPAEATPETPSAEEELEIPDWLAELADAPAEETPATSTIDAEPETADWLADITEIPPVEATLETSVDKEPAPSSSPIEEETPDWLTELPEVSSEEVEPPVIETRTEISSWLTESVEKSADEESTAESIPDVPEWLAELQEATPDAAEEEIDLLTEVSQAQPIEHAPSSPTAADAERPEWLPEIPEAPAEKTPTIPAGEELETPAWLAGLPHETPPDEAEAETPAWFASGRPAAPEPSAEDDDESPVTPEWKAELGETPGEDLSVLIVDEAVETPPEKETAPPRVPETPESEEPPASQEEEEEIPDWLAELGGEDDLVLPNWLSEPPKGVVQQTPSAEQQFEKEVASDEPGSPDWLLVTGTSSDDPLISTPPKKKEPPPEEEDKDDPDEDEPPPFPPSPESPPPPVGGQEKAIDQAESDRTPGEQPAAAKLWWRSLQTSKADIEEGDDNISESTGVLTDLSGLLPAQKLMAGTAVTELGPIPLERQEDAVLVAAHEFQAIATAVPRPATLPTPLTRRGHLIKGAIRAGLFLLLIVLIALPLLPGLQKVTDPTTNRRMPWTEPRGNLREVLDRQRRELISNELGIIDLQQPDSVALVSFDYSPATQGELQPLAEAVLGRLRGQGMRLIFVSLQPEGAALAQRTLESILEQEQDEGYGTRMINLGYLPGQVTAIRELAGGRLFGTISDYQSGIPFSQWQPNGWDDLQNIGQVDVVVNITDTPTTARWWVEQMQLAVAPDDGERFLVGATSVTVDPFLRPYRDTGQLDGLIAGINGAAAVEDGRKNFGPARQMLDSQSAAHLLIIILIAAGTMVGWMPSSDDDTKNSKHYPPHQPGSSNGVQSD